MKTKKFVMPMSRDDFLSMLGEGFHTGFRKGTDGPGSGEIWKLISKLDPKTWNQVLDFVAYGFEVSYNFEWQESE